MEEEFEFEVEELNIVEIVLIIIDELSMNEVDFVEVVNEVIIFEEVK